MSHRDEPREVGGIYPSQQYVVVTPKKRRVLTPEQREAGETWVFHTTPERPYVVGEKPPSTTVLKKPETYKTWLPIAGPERAYVTGKHAPRKTSVTLVKAPPSVRAELRRRAYEQRVVKAQAERERFGDIQYRLFGVQTKLASTEQSLREQSLIQQQRMLGYEFIGRKEGQLLFAPKETKGIAESLLGIHVPTLPELLGYSVPTPPELLGFGRMEPEHYSMMEPVAGFIGAFEIPVYTVAQWAKVKTPRTPPSLISGYSLKHPAYGIGAFTGAVVQTYLFGKAIEKSPLGPPLAKAEMWTISKVREPLIGTRLDKFLLEHSKYWATLQEYRAGKVVFGAKPKKWSPRVYHGKTTTPMSATLKKAIADTRGSVLLPQLLTTPKTLFTPSATVLPGAFLPQIIAVSTVLGIEAVQAPQTLSIMRIEAVQVPKPINMTKMRQTVKPKRLQRQKPMAFNISVTRQKLLGFNIPVTRQKERAKLIQYSRVVESLKSVNKQLTRQFQSQAEALSFKHIQLQQQMQILPQKYKLRLEKPKRRRKQYGLFGAWFKRTHPIKTPKQMLATFTGKPMRIKKRKKKKGKTRKKK